VTAIFILVCKNILQQSITLSYTKILEGLQQKLGELQPLSWRRQCNRITYLTLSRVTNK